MEAERKLSEYISLSKKIDDSELERKIKVGILSSFTLNGLDETLHVKCSEIDIGYRSYAAGYNQFNQEILDSSSNLYNFSPDITFLIMDVRSLLGKIFYYPYSISSSERKQVVEKKINELKNLIVQFKKNSNSKLIISNFSVPSYSSNGLIETKTEFGFHDMIREINKQLSEIVRNESSVYVYDFNQFISRFGENNVFKYKQFFIGDIRITFDYIPFLAYDFMGYVKPMLSLNRKCIVLDLDDTLWGGIVGEDGFDGIKLDQTSIGSAYVEFQKYLLSLWQHGVILAINSKNNFEDAIKVIKEHPEMVLREENFASMQINWNDKAQNLKTISKNLNIGLDSIVYFDDDPINQERIKQELPEVLTVKLPTDPSEYVNILKSLNDFNVLQQTEEDLNRGKMYTQQLQRKELEKSVTNLDDFLKQLDIKVVIKEANQFTIPRISQLTLKTNQFNLTTKRYQEEDIIKYCGNPNMKVGCAQIEDKFGDNGITNAFIIEKNPDVWVIDTFLLSCRVMGRGVEDAIISHILKDAKNHGAKKVKAFFIPTKKNKPAEAFLSNFGFKKENDYWMYDLNNPIKTPNHLNTEVE